MRDSLPAPRFVHHASWRRWLFGIVATLTVCLLPLLRVRAAEASANKAVRIGFQKSGAFLLVKNEGTLEKKLAPLGYRVEWREFPSGPPIFEALNGNGIDLGHSGDAPLIFAQSSGVPFVLLADTEASPESAGIVVPKDSPLRTPADLRGKKVAFTKGSSAHYHLARALTAGGLTFGDVTPVYLQPPDARAALQSGNVDAWAIWDPFFAAAEVDAGARTLTNGQGLTQHREFYFARRDWTEKNAAVLPAIFEALNESGAKALSDHRTVAAFLAPKLGISQAVLERSEARKRRYGALPVTPEVIAEQQGVADTFFKLGLIPKALDVKEVVYQPPGAR